MKMSEAKFVSLRKRLDQLGYRQSLSVDSVPLAERLLGDLLHTTESLKDVRLQLGKHKQQKVIWDQSVEPYKADNARLVQENNQLHQELMKAKESHDGHMRALRADLRKLEHENSDLKFLNTQYVQRLRAAEQEGQAKTEKIVELQEKNFQAVVHTPGGRQRRIPFRRQRMDVDCLVPPSGGGAQPRPPEPDPYVADLLKVADARVEELHQQLGTRDKQLRAVESSLSELRRQVESREDEIERLTEALRGGRPSEALLRGETQGSVDRTVAHMNVQLDFLQEANQKLEHLLEVERGRSQELVGRVAELERKNSAICGELQTIDELAGRLEEDKRSALSERDSKVAELEAERRGLLSSAEDNRRCLLELRQECGHLQAASEDLRALVSTKEETEQKHLRTIEGLREEVQHLKGVELMQRERVVQQGSGKALLEENRALRTERERLRGAIKEFDTELAQIQQDAHDLAKDRDNFKILYEQAREDLQRVRSEVASFPSSGQLRLVAVERDEAVENLTRVTAEGERLRERLKLMEESSGEERRALQQQVEGLQGQIQELSGQTASLSQCISSQRETVSRLETELQASAEALAKARADAKQHSSRARQLQTLLDSREGARLVDQGAAQVQREELDKARTELADLKRSMGELSGAEGALREQVQELRGALAELDAERDQMQAVADTRAQECAQLQERVEAMALEKAGLLATVAKLEESVSAAEERTGGREHEVASLRSQLSASEARAEQEGRVRAALEEELNRFKSDLGMMTQENQSLHEELQRAGQEQEALAERVRQYTQSIQRFEEAVAAKEDEKCGLLASLQALSDEKDRLDANVQHGLEESSSTRFQLATLTQERDRLQELVDHQTQEIEQHLAALGSYELQLSSLSSALSKMEHLLRQEQDEKRALHEDMSSLRELCAQLNRNKDNLTREMAAAQKENTKLQMQQDSLISERDYLKAQVSSQDEAVRGLEAILQGERTKEALGQQSREEQDAEINKLHSRLRETERSRSLLTQQLRATQSQLVSARSEGGRVGGFLHHEASSHSSPSTLTVDTPPVRRKDSLEPKVVQRERETMENQSSHLVEQLLNSSKQ